MSFLNSRTDRRPGAADFALTLYGMGLLSLSAVQMLAPQRGGLLALSAIFAPHLFLPLVVLLPLALLRRARQASVLLALAFALGVLRFGSGVISIPPTPTTGAQQVHVLSWNVAAGQVAGDVAVERLLGSTAQIVGLQELRPEHVASIEASEALTSRFPHRVLEPESGVRGMGLLSAFPVSVRETLRDPPLISATVGVGGKQLNVVTAHPLPARIRFLGGVFPVGYDPADRDDWFSTIHAPGTGLGPPDVMFGDFNVTDREPGYRDLRGDLTDVHVAVGLGPGSTWRPPGLDFLPFGILRIDYVFTGAGLRPLSIDVDCIPNTGDHCIVSAVVEIVDLEAGIR